MKDRYITEKETTDLLVFREVTYEDMPLILNYFRMYPSRSCDFSVGGVFIWTEYFSYMLAEVDDSLVIMGTLPDSGVRVFYEPRGRMDFNRYKDLVTQYCRDNGLRGIILLPEEFIMADNTSEVTYDENYYRDYTEYLYPIDKFITFAGRKYEKKRNHLNFFVNNYSPFEIEAISSDNIAELIAFTISFENSHEESELALYECRQVIDVLRDFGLYPFEGIALRKDGRIIGYTFGELTGDTFHVHAEKGDVSYRGVYQALASRMAKAVKDTHPQVSYLNREDDMGFLSLRRSKLSYRPSLVINKKVIEINP